ncbi:DMT family transporter [Candidatus Cardinium hertigii]|jgi:drug/metabolite transporter (DMT)-like permease|uniref:DMT family transporter n=1 Tax=Candidatus Cardinium hertigii TaxID=247481 RepID=A0A3N2QAT7_9BACT|nr:DMT family transporter [Candidatus Cardinium hertigii]ROT46908.1 DMT family transporter [Candidatus Cardinium hertigii]
MELLKRSNMYGAIFATLSALSLTISMALTSKLSSDIPTVFVVFIKTCFGFTLLMPFIIKKKSLISKPIKYPLHLLRIILSLGAILCTYYTYRNLPVAFATSIGMTEALFTTILSVIILKENIGFWKWSLVFSGYCGVILIIRPTSFALEFAIITALLANLLCSASFIILKIISRYNAIPTIMLHANLAIIIISGLLSAIRWKNIQVEDRDMVILFCNGALAIISQFCSVKALKYANPSFIAPFQYTRMPFAILIDIIIFKKSPDGFTIIGSIIIICSAYLLSYIADKKSNLNL